MADTADSASIDPALHHRQLREQAAGLRAAEALGRSPALTRLFAFLLDCALDGRSPKELEIAAEVFGRRADGGDQDASIRVQVHRLRRKLDDFYAGPGKGQTVRLVIPRGAYRLAVEPVLAVADAPASAAPQRGRGRLVVAAVAAAAIAVAVALVLLLRPGATDRTLRSIQSSALWRSATSNARPVVIVVGDYYLFGERDEEGNIHRLLRDFDVNSSQDLARVAERDPNAAARYVDLGLDYLPVGVGNALRRVIPVIAHDNLDALPTLRVVAASKLTPAMLKSNDLVYVGFVSGLGSLRDPEFGGSRFGVGDSYDEIVDRRTGRHYLAGTHLEPGNDRVTRDYALVSSFAGINGNRVVVIAGTRDAALMQAADYVTRAASLADLDRRTVGSDAFDVLLAIDSLNDEGLRAGVVAVAPRPRDADWSGSHPQVFPDDVGHSPSATP